MLQLPCCSSARQVRLALRINWDECRGSLEAPTDETLSRPLCTSRRVPLNRLDSTEATSTLLRDWRSAPSLVLGLVFVRRWLSLDTGCRHNHYQRPCRAQSSLDICSPSHTIHTMPSAASPRSNPM